MAMGKAAKLTGRETTLARSVKAGRLSASRRDDTGYQDAAALLGELHRAYPFPAPTEAVAATASLRTEFAKARLADLKQVALAMGVPLFVSTPQR
jgi:hypothetical protein